MNASAITVQLPPPPSYGAVEIKEFIRKNTFRGLIITLGLLLLFLLFYFVYGKITEPKSHIIKRAPISRINLMTSAQQTDDQQQEEAPPPPPDKIITYATAARAGIPVPVPDAEIKADLKDFASFNDVNKSLSANEGQVIDFNQLPKDFDLNQKVEVKKEEIPDENEFIAVEKEPVVDLEELQKKIVYPDMARRAGIEGKVILRVFVDKTGKAKQVKVAQSDSQLLDKAAVDAAYKTVYVPAIQNGQPVGTWVSIPVKFTLK